MTLSVIDLAELVGKSAKVRVWHNRTSPDAPPDFEGELIGLYNHPSIIIRDGDGKQTTHSTRLRIEVVPLPWEPPSGSAVAANDSVWLRCYKGWFDGFQSGSDIEFLTWAQLHARHSVRPLVYDLADGERASHWSHKDPDGMTFMAEPSNHPNKGIVHIVPSPHGGFLDIDATVGLAAWLLREARAAT